MSVANPAPPTTPVRHRPIWALPAVVIAVVAVAIAAVVAIRGLLANPVVGTDSAGVTTLRGDFEPYSCCPVTRGYVQAGARSVFVLLRPDCPVPQRGSQVVILGRLDTSQGSGTYREVQCPAPG